MKLSKKQFLKNLRRAFNEKCLKRDCKGCVCCKLYGKEGDFSEGELDVHHITDRHEMPNDGYHESNGITLCPVHHLLAERFHMTGGLESVEGYHPDDLYKMINSSKEKAIELCKTLSP